MVDFSIIPADVAHLLPIAKGMREADRIEIDASGGLEPYQALKEGLDSSSRCWTALVNGKPCVMFGVVPFSVLGGVGSPWLLGTDDATLVKKQFLLQGRKLIPEMLRLYPTLINLVDARNSMSIRWLKWLGFDVKDPIPYGQNSELFHPFEMRAG